MQMAIQYTFYRLHKYSVATYETGATRQYFHGRTETVRSCSYLAQKFARTMLNPQSSPEEKRECLKAAVVDHSNYMKRAVSGNVVFFL
jgi:hypothetical protein